MKKNKECILDEIAEIELNAIELKKKFRGNEEMEKIIDGQRHSIIEGRIWSFLEV